MAMPGYIPWAMYYLEHLSYMYIQHLTFNTPDRFGIAAKQLQTHG